MKRLTFLSLLFIQVAHAQKANDVTAPLHALKVDYPTPYGAPKTEAVKSVIDRVYNYLDATTPTGLVNRKTGEAVSLNAVDTNTVVKPGDFRLTSYEWGVTYSGMLEASAATGDPKYADYTKKRVDFILSALPA
ncbi:MAG: glycoside hydrolase family 88 protein, partial [Chitinophagaceae bacterium]